VNILSSALKKEIWKSQVIMKARSEDALLKDLHKRFAFLGESTAVIFLFSVGEEMPETIKRMQTAHGTK
jgi:hypothetical protein